MLRLRDCTVASLYCKKNEVTPMNNEPHGTRHLVAVHHGCQRRACCIQRAQVPAPATTLEDTKGVRHGQRCGRQDGRNWRTEVVLMEDPAIGRKGVSPLLQGNSPGKEGGGARKSQRRSNLGMGTRPNPVYPELPRPSPSPPTTGTGRCGHQSAIGRRIPTPTSHIHHSPLLSGRR